MLTGRSESVAVLASPSVLVWARVSVSVCGSVSALTFAWVPTVWARAFGREFDFCRSFGIRFDRPPIALWDTAAACRALRFGRQPPADARIRATLTVRSAYSAVTWS
jgi:hypothetical protein